MRLPPRLINALEATGLPWETVIGGSHTHIRLAGKLAGILPKNLKGKELNLPALQKTIAQIKRVAREVKSESNS